MSGVGTIRGRSRSAYLAEPYAATRDFQQAAVARSIQQLAGDELPAGWTLNWSAVDWVLPASTFKYERLAPMDAISSLARSAGGFVYTDPLAQTISVFPRYPAAPWNWEAQVAALNLPRDVLFQRSSDKSPGTAANAVYVHGDGSGAILAKIRRTGSAGDVLAPTIVDALITDNNAARERGIGALAQTARQSVERYDLPLGATFGGLRRPGELVAIGSGDAPFVKDFTAFVQGVSVSAVAGRATNGGATLQVRQSLILERYFSEPI